jgi:hypothetical protein
VADAMTLDELERHDDPRVRALVRELRAARDVVELARKPYYHDRLCGSARLPCEVCNALEAYDAAKAAWAEVQRLGGKS